MLHPGGNTPDMEEKYTYYAFISYKHEDEKWAKWIQNKLETYKLPSVLQRESRELPSRITPIFRDKTDITSGPLKKTLSRELEASKYLIVICSPRSAKSPYVNYEVEQFALLGRQDRIIPFIVEGIVGAKDPEKECYVPALLNMDETILGVDLPKLGKRKTFLTIIATMLDIKLDTLVHRDKARRRRKNILAAAAIIVLMILSSFVLDYYIPKTGYYSDYVLKWGIPKGIFKLDTGFLFFGNNELKGKDDFYIITESKADKTITLKHVNSAKVPIDYHTDTEQNDRPVIAEYKYVVTDKIKHAAAAKYMDRYSNVLLVLKYSDDSTIIDFTSGDGSNSPMTLSSNLFAETGTLDIANMESKSSITRYIYGYDEDGFISSVKFMRDNRSTSPTPDQNGITGYTCTVDSYGRIISKKMNYSFDNTLQSKVFDHIIYIYDYFTPELTEVRYVDANDNPVYNNESYAIKKFTYYTNRNLSDITYFGPNGEWCRCPDGYARVTIQYDERGFHREQVYFDERGYTVNAVYGYSKEVISCDRKGNIMEASVYDTLGNRMIALPVDTNRYASGFATIRRKYNKDNILTEEAYYDVDDKSMLCTSGFAKLKVTYDDHGRVSEIGYYDINGEPIACTMGFEKFEKKYNEFGLVTSWIYSNADGTLSETTWGYSRLDIEFDDNRNVKTYSFYGKNEEPVMNSDHIARQELVWDDRGFLTELKNYDENGNPVNSIYGYAATVKEFNNSGLMTKDIYYNPEGSLIFVEDIGYAKFEGTYDDKGNLTHSLYYDDEDKLELNNMGYAEYKARYSDRGNLIEEAYYGADGNMIVPTDFDWARRAAAFTEDSLPMCESFFDADNQPVVNKALGYAKAFAEYDQWNNISLMVYYDARGEVFVSPQYGYASVEHVFQDNLPVRTSFYDEKGKLVISPVENYAKLIQKWDDNGRLLESSTYGENGKPMKNLFHFTSVRYSYNKDGRQTECRYLDENGRLTVALNWGYAKQVDQYNQDGEWEGAIYYDQDNEVIDFGQMVTKAFVYVDTVTTQSAASEAGVHVNDLVLQYEDWRYLPINEDDETFTLLAEEMTKRTDQPKTLIVYRPTDSSIHTFEFGSEMAGVHLTDVNYRFPDQEAYEAFISELGELYQRERKK